MSSLNKVLLIGNLGKDPELRTTTSGKSVVNFSIATNENYTDKDGKKVAITEWHDVVVWNKLAEIAKEHLKKGDKVYIEGKSTTNKWEDENGNARSRKQVTANIITFLNVKSALSTAEEHLADDDLPY